MLYKFYYNYYVTSELLYMPMNGLVLNIYRTPVIVVFPRVLSQCIVSQVPGYNGELECPDASLVCGMPTRRQFTTATPPTITTKATLSSHKPTQDSGSMELSQF